MYFLVCVLVFVVTQEAACEQAPKIELHPNSIIVNVSDPVTLECRVSGEPRPRISWLKDGHVLDIDHLKSKYTLIHGSNLFIFAASLGRHDKSDAGSYQCRGDNEYGTATSHNASLMITFLREDFRDMPKSRQVKSGTQVIMECKAPKGHPEPTVYWTKNNRPLDPDSGVIYPNGTLLIPSAGLNDNGEYVCVAKNDAGSKQTPPAFLNVFEKPTIVAHPDDSRHMFQDRVELSCEATGFPRPQIEWKKDGSYENIPLKSIIKDNSLIIASIEYRDEGEYTCVATNQLASVEHTFTVSVYDKPSFSKHMANVTIGIESRSLLIECNARGRPAPVIYWAKSATTQFQSGAISHDDFLILENGNLFIEKLSKKYEGVYLCQASNEFGTVETKTLLHVKQVDERPPPLIVQHPQNQTVPINTQATLECTSESAHAFDDQKTIVKWFKDNKPISVANSLKYRLLDNGHLLINTVQTLDSGLYQCHVINTYSHTKSLPAQLSVQNPQNQFVQFQRNHLSSALPSAPNQPLVLKVGTDSATLSWPQMSGHSTGHSPLRSYQIEYYSPEWPVLLPGWTLLVDNIPAHQTTYHAANLSPHTSYMFTVRARNSQGLGPPSAPSDPVRTEPERVASLSNAHELIEQALAGQVVQLNEPAQVLTATSINITWKLLKAAHLIHGFYVKYKPVGSAHDYAVDHVATAKANYHVIHNLKKFTTYEILLEPYSGTFRAAESNIVQAKTLQDAPSHSPLHLHTQLVNSHSLSIKWQAPPNHYTNGIIVGYRVSCAANDTTHSINLNTNSTTRAIIVGNLVAHTQYCVKVAAFNKVGTGPYTPVQCIHMSTGSKSTNAGAHSPMSHFMHQAWFLGLVSLVLGALILLCALYFVWLFYKRRLHIKKSSSKKYLSNNSTLLSESRVDKNGNRYKLVGNDAHVWLDTMQSDEAKSTPSPGPQYAEVYASATNPYATTGLFVKPEHNLYNILSYQQTMPPNAANSSSSSYTIKLLNEPDQKKLIKYLQSQTQSQTNTPKVALKALQQQRVKSVENSQVTVNMTQQQLFNYLTHQYGPHACQQYQQQQQQQQQLQQHQHHQQPNVPVVPPPSLPQWSDPSNSSSLVSNLTSNSTLSRNGSTFTAQQYVNRIKQLNLQQHHNFQPQQQQQDYSSISPEDEVVADEFRFINQKQSVARNEANQAADDYLNLEPDICQASNKKFLFLNQNNLNSNEIYVSDEMPQTVL